MEFSEVSLAFEHEKANYSIQCVQAQKTLTLQLYKSGVEQYSPLKVALNAVPAEYRSSWESKQKARERYGGLQPDKTETALWNFLRDVHKPRMIHVDRTSGIFASSVDEDFSQDTYRHRLETSPLDDVRKLTTSAYGTYRANLILLNRELQEQIIQLSFRIHTNKTTGRYLAPESVTRLRARSLKLFKEGYISEGLPKDSRNNILKEIEKFFKNFNEGKCNENDIARVEEIIKVFETFDSKAEAGYSAIQKFLNCVNSFLSDSGKKLKFEGSTNKLCFVFETESDNYRDLAYLASGEGQLVTLLSFIAFLSDQVVLIDEPEVSLHPAWQDRFLAAVNNLISPTTQLIFATHSPAIVGTEINLVTSLDG